MLQGSIGVLGLGLLAACAPAAPAAPTAAPARPAEPAKPTEAPKPAEAAKPAAPAAAAPTAPAAAAPAKPAEAAKPSEAAKPAAPAAAAKPDDRIGRNLVGKVEGPTVITDAAQFPKSFKEAPQLAELVKAGKLPPVQERIGQDPLVLKPVQEVGKYGGIWRRGFTGPADYLNGIRAAAGPDFLLFVDPTGTQIVPNLVRGYEVTEGGRVTTLQLRRGMRWSDGQPFTADDFMFWFEDVYQNKELVPAPTSAMAINGKPGVLEKVDASTVRFRFPDPHYLLPETLAFSLSISGQATNGLNGMGAYMPAQYLKQFHPKYTPRETLDRLAAEAKFDNWVNLFKFKANWALNPDLPVVSPWKTTQPANTPNWTLERNPYSIWVDTDGNQLPYIDKVQFSLGENLEVVNLRAIAGEYDLQARHIDIGKLPVLLENQQKGNYKVSINPMASGSDFAIHFNLHYEADPEIGKWLNAVDFRHALSLGVDRDQVNEALFLGVGIPGSTAPAESNKYSPGPEWRTKWCTYDVKQANELLDKVGLTQKDGEGYRLRTDGKGRLSIEITTLGGQFIQYTRIAEMIRDQWKKIGIDLRVNEMERSLAIRRGNASENQLLAFGTEGTDTLYSLSGWIFPIDSTSWYMPEAGRWFQSNGAQGKEPPGPMKQAMEMWKQAFGVPAEEQVKMGKEIWKIALETQWAIGVVGQSGAVEGIQVAKNDLGNVPSAYANINLSWPPNISRPVTYYWKK
ncbi:MAG: ABC transporter substrate-binding protein [Chloroflexi bacterium]|nr:ABC transporter substrate-binding protein [Chloroflexota bacterium]